MPRRPGTAYGNDRGRKPGSRNRGPRKHRWRLTYLRRISQNLLTAQVNLNYLVKLFEMDSALRSRYQGAQIRRELVTQVQHYQRLEKKSELLAKLIEAKSLGLLMPKGAVPKGLAGRHAKTLAEYEALTGLAQEQRDEQPK